MLWSVIDCKCPCSALLTKLHVPMLRLPRPHPQAVQSSAHCIVSNRVFVTVCVRGPIVSPQRAERHSYSPCCLDPNKGWETPCHGPPHWFFCLRTACARLFTLWGLTLCIWMPRRVTILAMAVLWLGPLLTSVYGSLWDN